MSEPIKILHVFGRLGHGGAELRTMEILRHVDRRRYRFHFCALSGLPGELEAEIRALGAEVHRLARSRIGFAGRFRGLLRQLQPQVVCTHVLYYSGFIQRLAGQCNVPVRAVFFRSLYDGRGSGPGRRMYRQLMRHWIDRYATHILAVGEAAMAGAWGPHWRSDPRCQVIYNGLEPARFETETDPEAVRQEFGVPPEAPLYIHVGHMRKPKNHLRLLSIFAEVLQQQPAARLLMVGRGGNRIERRVGKRIAELGIRHRVVLCGQRTDVPRLLGAADALIFPSLWEGLPGAVLEACAAGTPVLASDLPGVREIAARLPQVHCLSLDAEDAKWAQVLGEIPGRRDAESARRQARQSFAGSVFTISQCAGRHCRVWQGLGPEPTARDAA